MLRNKYKIIFVGGGIAGITGATRIQDELKEKNKENGVLLVEKAKTLSSKSSCEQHGWAHLVGAVHFHGEDPTLPQSRLDNLYTILNYYQLPGNNLTVEKGQIIKQDTDSSAWYRPEPIYFYYSMPDYNFGDLQLSPEKQEKWKTGLQKVLVRNKAVLNHNWENEPINLIKKADESKEGAALYNAKNLSKKWMRYCAEKKQEGALAKKLAKEQKILNVDLNQCMVVTSMDCPMSSGNIMTSLLNHYQLNGGTIQLETEIKSYKSIEKGIELTTTKGEKIIGEEVIFTTGDQLEKVIPEYSALLVVNPPVCERNFVLMTPYPNKTINHLLHTDPKSGKQYSVIGNSDRASPGDTKAMQECADRLKERATTIFPQLSSIPQENQEIYFGIKADTLKTEEKELKTSRKIQYNFFTLSDHVSGAIPGKFTLSPSLSDHMVEKLLNKKPGKFTLFHKEKDQYEHTLKSKNAPISSHLHAQIVGNYVDDIEQRQQRNMLNIFNKK
jgi:hypothetical protein